jgi:hypothetical protein
MKYSTNILLKIIIGIIAAVIIGAFVSNYVRTGVGRGDFTALYENSVHAIQTGRISDPESLGYYPPSGRPILMAMALLPLRPAAAVWFVLAVLLEGISLYLLVNHLLPTRPKDPWLLAAMSVLAITPWLSADLSGGNISALILGSVVISYYFYRKNRPWLSGLVLGVGIAVKFLPVFMIFFYAIKRRWKMTLIACLMTLAVSVIPGSLLFGPRDFAQSWKVWSDSALSIRTAKSMILEGQLSYVNQSWANVLLHTLHPVDAGHRNKVFFVNIANLPRNTILKIWYAFMAVSALLWVILLWPRKNDPSAMMAVHFPLVCIPMLWFSPHVMSYYMTILMPAVVFLFWALHNRNEPWLKPLATTLLVLLGLYILGDISVASRYVRAYGSYQWTILVLAMTIALVAREARHGLPTDTIK